jgi:hypothetical protein
MGFDFKGINCENLSELKMSENILRFFFICLRKKSLLKGTLDFVVVKCLPKVGNKE